MHFKGAIALGLVAQIFHFKAEAIGAHAIHAAAKHRILDSGIRGYHHHLQTVFARIICDFLNDLIGRRAIGRKDHLHAADTLGFTCRFRVIGAIKNDNRLVLSTRKSRNVADQRLANLVERFVGVVFFTPHVYIALTASQHVVPVDDKKFVTFFSHENRSIQT